MWEREVDEARDKRRTKRVFMCEMYRIHAALRKINVTVKARPRGRSFFGIGIRTTSSDVSFSPVMEISLGEMSGILFGPFHLLLHHCPTIASQPFLKSLQEAL